MSIRIVRGTIIWHCVYWYEFQLKVVWFRENNRCIDTIAPRSRNRRSWFYRIRPSVLHNPFTRLSNDTAARLTYDWNRIPPNPNQVSKFITIFIPKSQSTHVGCWWKLWHKLTVVILINGFVIIWSCLFVFLMKLKNYSSEILMKVFNVTNIHHDWQNE